MQIPYDSKPEAKNQEIYRTESYILQNDNKSKVISPGEFIEIQCDPLKEYNDEITVQPKIDSPVNNWARTINN